MQAATASRTTWTSPAQLPGAVRALILAAALWALSLPLTVVSGSAAAILGCLAGTALLSRRSSRLSWQRLRTPTLLLGTAILASLGLLLAASLAGSALVAEVLGPIRTFELAEMLRWFSLGTAIAVGLRVVATRSSLGRVLEIVFVAVAFVVTLSAHRNGMIHRPFLLGDFAITRGIDPATILMGFGCAAVLALAALLMVESDRRRLPYHFAVLGALCLSLVLYVRIFGLPTPSLTDDLGLTGSAQNGSSASENPFRDGENDTQDKEAPVAVVVFRDDYEPLNGAYYFRESAYSQFNGSMLDFTTRDDMDRDLIERLGSTRVEAELMPGARDQRTPVRTTIGMLVAHRSPFGLASPVAYEEVSNPNTLRFKRTYDSYSLAPNYQFEYLLDRELGHPDWSPEVWQEYLTLPADPRYGELARELVANLRPEYADDAFAKAWAIKSYLDENGIYSLKNEHAYESDPAASFLFGDLTGYCMHFAFAATYMYRSLGIPARVGIGYSVPAANRSGGSSLLVQAIHGHAWPEIYFRDVGWVIVDPAPQQTLVDMSTDPQNELQQLLGDMLRDEAAFEEFLQSRQTSMLDFRRLLLNTGLVLLVMLLGSYLLRGYRQLVPITAGPQAQYRVSYRAALDQLAAMGIVRRPGESREQFARRIESLSPGFSSLTCAHLATALGPAQSPTMNQQQWRELRQQVHQELGQNSRRWRRLLALINPIPWLLVR